MKVGIIGAGRVGAVLGAALARSGHALVAAVAVSAASKARAAALLPEARLLPADHVAAAADLLILAVPDDALGGLVAGLADLGAIRPGQIVAHTSGAHGLAVLAPVAAAGAFPLALHPAMTFTGTAADLDRLAAGISFGVTAPDELRPFAARLVSDLGGVVEWVEEQKRPLYHAALAHGANHLATLVAEAMDRLRDAGVHQPERVLAPLLGAALDNTLRMGDAAITGPVSRGDAGTVRKHLQALDAVAPGSVPPYLALARRTADRVIAAGRLRPQDAAPLLDVLSASEKEPVT
ncbi:Rossmann-like and DUF2520 domain-containing protein [Dactylosporangium matsuzakiense]|uniref:Short-subunit dehydrogenase-like oxidoreductase (DUF2520 family) n=1 Tax=Dactylosporangium matsuzakiense TaxID=53360 RepID=A0A9W6KEJ1_9ACTN|nr:Rossmann-like and DUF2520 domain-containing protein [Dactylosporangium matsuzakiense]UWZ45204.1 DUF2520 domain-containing protein [Dactylosporangium matsuzakiense]GLK98835.1 hypothetical protein GCM10017581_005760 [Dactylosporangium matsuzakiense]